MDEATIAPFTAEPREWETNLPGGQLRVPAEDAHYKGALGTDLRHRAWA